MPDTQVSYVVTELHLELVTRIGSDLQHSKRKLGDDMINKINRLLSPMAFVDL